MLPSIDNKQKKSPRKSDKKQQRTKKNSLDMFAYKCPGQVTALVTSSALAQLQKRFLKIPALIDRAARLVNFIYIQTQVQVNI